MKMLYNTNASKTDKESLIMQIARLICNINTQPFNKRGNDKN